MGYKAREIIFLLGQRFCASDEIRKQAKSICPKDSKFSWGLLLFGKLSNGIKLFTRIETTETF